MDKQMTRDEIMQLLHKEYETEKKKSEAAFNRGYNALGLNRLAASRTIEKLIKKINRKGGIV